MKYLLNSIVMILLMSLPAVASDRVALVIGNADYAIGPLRNPTNDATDIARKLQKLGFDVTLLKNADQRTMESQFNGFRGKLAKAKIRLFYYAGHGMQVDGVNYLIPLKTNVQHEDDIKYEAVAAGRVLETMGKVGKGANIVILDACRNNPFKRSFRSSTRGLARMPELDGSIIVYATSPGDVALDGNGRNGVFTEHFLHYLDQPGLTLEQVFKRTGRAVSKVTNNSQRPWLSLGLYDDVYLAGRNGGKIDEGVLNVGKPAPKPASKPVKPRKTKWKEPTTGMEFVRVPSGCFKMGSNKGAFDEKPVHKVCVDGFWIGKYEVTQQEWEKVMGDNPSFFVGERYPVESVFLDDIEVFISKLNEKGNGTFRLPTEAEWEYAARAGTRTEYWWGEHVASNKRQGYFGTSRSITVGYFKPNAFGLYDTAGNVAEWCRDWYGETAYSESRQKNPVNLKKSEYRVVRGGSWGDTYDRVRSASREGVEPDYNGSSIGFRLVRE